MDDAPLQALHVPELPLVQNVFPGGVDASTHTPSSAVLLGPACGDPKSHEGLAQSCPEAKVVSTEHWGLFPVPRKIV